MWPAWLLAALLGAGCAAVVPTTGASASASRDSDSGPDAGPSRNADAGDPVRGRAIVVDRQLGMCLLCHHGPFPEERAMGDLAPDLRGAGSRWTPAQLRERIADPTRLNPATIMPAYARTDGLWRVAPAARGKPLLSPTQIDDVVAFLATLTS